MISSDMMYKYLDSIKTPADVKALNKKELNTLCAEIRDFLVKSVSETGGHLASNLGVVELTISILRAFDLPEDKIIWDVGHQTYVYKLLTGRKDRFDTLRKYGGLSGFPKTSESIYDSFNTGHSSTSISAAFGIAKAKDLLKEGGRAVAVIGDGALTGGMAYEAINAAGLYKKNFIVILNDNEMSISKNVGSISKHLTRLRSKPLYFKIKAVTERAFLRIPFIGEKLVKLVKRIKDGIRYMITRRTVVDYFGFTYLGPIDGHDIDTLTYVLKRAQLINNPVFVHVLTKKGKGYDLAENMPTKYHGISGAGKKIKEESSPGTPKTYSEAFGAALCSLAEKNDKICAITAAMPDGTGLCGFAEKFPERFFDVAICEQHAVTFAAGLAKEGLKPVFAVYSTFLQRAYDQIFHDVCLQKLDVVFCIDRAGLVGDDGETHQGILDISYMSAMPDMTVLAPCNFSELKKMLEFALNEHKGPVAIRYPRGGKELISDRISFEFGKISEIESGEDVIILFVGNMGNIAANAHRILKENGISAALGNLSTVSPIDEDYIISVISRFSLAAVIEDGAVRGGAGEAIAAYAAKKGAKTRILIKGHKNAAVPHGSINELYRHCGLDEVTIAKEIMEYLNE